VGTPLDRHGLIFVSATSSGNEERVLDRRLPLALLAWENVRARYPIDPKRVYVGGLSGGSRAAEITALAYADVFRGFQETRLVYVTGEADDVNLHDDKVSRASMRDWCVFNVEVKYPRKLGHEPLDRASFDQALDALEQKSAVDPGELARCNARVQRELAAKLAEAEAAIVRGDRDEARAQLRAIDGQYGGLAAPAILDLNARM